MADHRHVLITGGSGQVGSALANVGWPEHIALHTPTRRELDLAQTPDVQDWLKSNRCDAIINAGAYTAVDAAEDDAATAFQVNAAATAVLAHHARAAGVPMIQVSTDYVFDGRAERAYLEGDTTGPLSVYGASKLAGELAVSSSKARAVIVRTAWVLSTGGRNFATTMLRLARSHDTIRVVSDQHGCPTSADDLALALRDIALAHLKNPAAATGTFHFTNAGQTSWADLARRIFARSAALGGPAAEVTSIGTEDYPTAAIRPANSRLDTTAIRETFSIRIRPWENAIDEIVAGILAEQTTS